MNSGRSYIGSAEHAADIHAVTSAADNQLIAKIRSFEATGNEVVAWYGTADPCYEDMRLQIYGQLASSTYSPEEHLGRYLRETVKETTTHQAAAFTMLADVAGIIEHREDQGPWHTSNHPLLETTRNQPGEIIAKRMVDSITPTLKIDDFDKLYIAADCLHEAGRGFGYLHSLQQNGILGTRHPADFAERSQSYISTATFLAKNMVERILTDSTETEQVAARPTLHKLGAFLCNISLEESLRHNRNSGSGKDMNQPEKVAIGNLVSLIRTSYLDLDKSKVVKGSEKGDLHELVYLLDLNYLLCTRRPTSGDWVAKASTLRQDAPKIGYPRKNRGSDFLITDGDIGFQVQLKSSKADTS